MFIAAAANEREENIGKWSCTLFRPEWQDSSIVLFYHSGTSKMVTLDWEGDIYNPLLLSAANRQDAEPRYFTFQVVDVEAIVRLPKRVSFKGDNGKYLCTHVQDGVPYLSFTRDDNSEEVSHYEILENKHGEIRIKSLHTKNLLRYGDNGWIVADVEPERNPDHETLFKVVKVGDNVVALRFATGEFCKRVVDGHWLRACNESYVVHEGRFVVGEPVFDRRIHVQFQFKDAKIYDKEVSQTAAISVVNGTDEKHELSQGFCYTKTHSGTWGSSDQLKLGTEATLTAGVPFFVKETIKLSAEYARTWTRGTSDDYSKQITSTYTVPVPAKTMATVNLISEKARYDIPYFYHQTDTYTNGEKFTTFLKDGIYHGVEAYNFYYQPKYEPISSNSDESFLPTLPKKLHQFHADDNKIILKSEEPSKTTLPS